MRAERSISINARVTMKNIYIQVCRYLQLKYATNFAQALNKLGALKNIDNVTCVNA